MEERGDSGLIGAKQVRCRLLSKFAFLNEVANPVGDLRLGVEFLGVGQLQIFENIFPALADGLMRFHGFLFSAL